METFSCALKQTFCLRGAKGVKIKFLSRPASLPPRFSLPTKKGGRVRARAPVCGARAGAESAFFFLPVGFAGGRGGGEESADVNGSVLNLDAKSA